jgi:WD40 repeat protein
MILVGVNLLAVGSESSINIYDIVSKTLSRKLSGHSGLLRDLCLLDDYNTLVTSSDDKTIKIWDLEKGTCIKSMTGHVYSANRTIQYSQDVMYVY